MEKPLTPMAKFIEKTKDRIVKRQIVVSSEELEALRRHTPVGEWLDGIRASGYPLGEGLVGIARLDGVLVCMKLDEYNQHCGQQFATRLATALDYEGMLKS